ncbi:MAG: nucleotidyltransferase domain-containing protein [Thermoprotei archaeon]|nr:MAG: nucleotidyltransferase domain-containing protein [Thermoprotei archaeon]
MQRRSSSGLRKKLLRRVRENIANSDELFKKYVKKIIAKYPKSSIALIGSRAKNYALPYSDYDLVIILKRVHNTFKLIETIRKHKPRGFNLDLIVLEESELADPIVKAMLKDCVVLYDGLGIFKCPK